MGLGTYLWSASILTPPLGLPPAQQVTSVPIGDVWIDTVEIRIPRGHRGTTGIQLANSQTPFLPQGTTSLFILGDDEALTFDVGVEVDSGLEIVTYNQDVYNHTHLVRISGRPMVVQGGYPAATPTDVVPIS